jgi:hypothetical protein
VGAVAVVLLGLQFSGHALSTLFRPKVDSDPGQLSVGAERIVLYSRSATGFDFGVLDRGGRAEKTFAMHNPGPSAVTVAEVTTSCECLRVELADRVIRPGESTSRLQLFVGDVFRLFRLMSQIPALCAISSRGELRFSQGSHSTAGVRKALRTTRNERYWERPAFSQAIWTPGYEEIAQSAEIRDTQLVLWTTSG